VAGTAAVAPASHGSAGGGRRGGAGRRGHPTRSQGGGAAGRPHPRRGGGTRRGSASTVCISKVAGVQAGKYNKRQQQVCNPARQAGTGAVLQ